MRSLLVYIACVKELAYPNLLFIYSVYNWNVQRTLWIENKPAKEFHDKNELLRHTRSEDPRGFLNSLRGDLSCVVANA